MGQLEDMALFVRIVESGGIGKASGQLSLAKSAVSRRLSELEKRLGTQLLSRTTRKSSLTEAGELYYKRALEILDEVDTLNEQTTGIKSRLEGTLKMTAPLSFGLLHLSSLIDEYAKAHKELKFQINFSDHHVDLIKEGYELAIRIGDLEDSSYQARRITPIKHVMCASADYLQNFGTPQIPADLTEHCFLQYGAQTTTTLKLMDLEDNAHLVQLNAKMKTNNGDFLKDMATKGHGISFLPTFLVYQELATGDLIPILKDYYRPHIYVYAIYPKNRFLSQRCRLLIDFIAERFGDQPYWDRFTKP